MSAFLVVISGPLTKDAAFPIDTKEILIGRDEASGIRVDGKSVSRQHCRIRQQDGAVVIFDLGSRNGTFVNSSPIKERALEHGDLIQVGEAYFRS